MDLGATAINGYSAFRKAGTSPSDCLVSYLGHSLVGGGLTHLPRCSQCILQPQLTGQESECNYMTGVRTRKLWCRSPAHHRNASPHFASPRPGFELGPSTLFSIPCALPQNVYKTTPKDCIHKIKEYIDKNDELKLT